jgi:asparagine synthase (glutamine-hydrolysing)
MCGIAGIINNSSYYIEQGVLEAMTEALSHRGPDAHGTRILSSGGVCVGLGHRRLSIIDLSAAGHQPMANEDGTVWITYNGEVYNFPELREDLAARGHVFSSHTDTETIIHGYEEYGEGLFDMLNGMFAFALWDCRKDRLYLVRDRYGKKPLYYGTAGDDFVFASELKSIMGHPSCSREIDPENLSRYLLHEYVPAPHSILKDIHKLLPGHYLCWEDGRLRTGAYWRISFDEKGEAPGIRQAEEEVLSLLKQSVKRRLVSDVPLGVFLSGGIDSSAIVALMSEILPPDRIKTFCIGFDDPSFDESAPARTIASLFGTDHHEQILTASKMPELLPEVWDFLDEPLADASIIPTYLLSKFSRQTVTVALGGDGGDELFAGYDPFVAHRLAGLYDWVPRFIHSGVVVPLAGMLPVSLDNMSFDFRVKHFLKGIPYPPAIRNQVWLGSFSREEQQGIFNQGVRACIKGFDPYRDIEESERGMAFRDRMDEIVYLYSRFYLADDILTKVDRASMATSLEVRAPFLDRDFAEYVNSCPRGSRSGASPGNTSSRSAWRESCRPASSGAARKASASAREVAEERPEKPGHGHVLPGEGAAFGHLRRRGGAAAGGRPHERREGQPQAALDTALLRDVEGEAHVRHRVNMRGVPVGPEDAETARPLQDPGTTCPRVRVHESPVPGLDRPPPTRGHPGKTVLELGCGNASLMVHMADMKPSYLEGVDLGDSVLSARENMAMTAFRDWKVSQET